MAKTLNHNLKPYIIALLILLVGLLFFLVSCSEAKKGQKAVNRVNADANLQDQVVGKWFDTHPIDTTPRIFVSPPKIVEVKTENIEEKLQDEYSKPSFEWEESLYTVNEDNLSIYTDGTFTMSDVLLNYYRYPSQIRLIDDQDPESKFTSASIIEWDDKALDDIITLMVFNLDINENNPRFQLQTIRAQK